MIDGLLERRHRRALVRHRALLPALPPPDAALLAALRRDGIVATDLDALGLGGSADLLARAGEIAEGEAPAFGVRSAAGTPFIIARPDAMLRHPALFAWGLHDRLLNLAEAYLGLPAGYDGVVLQHTPVDPAEVATRAWHRDREDRAMLKIAIYCNDVGEEGGPFQLLPPAEGAAPVTILGRAGTVILADTARHLHRGLPATKRARTALFYSYFARRPRHPYFCDRSGLSRRQVRRLVMPLPRRQREAALWREALPWPWRILPAAPL